MDAIIVAGGRATRLGGVDKTALRYRGRALLDHAIESVALADRVVVVGLPGGDRYASRIRFVTEEPRWSGPAAAIARGLDELFGHDEETGSSSAFTAVIASDLPHAPAALALVLGAGYDADQADGVVAVDYAGRRQPLLAVYRTSALRAAARQLAAARAIEGASVRQLIAPLSLNERVVPTELLRDVDTPSDAARHGIMLDTPVP